MKKKEDLTGPIDDQWRAKAREVLPRGCEATVDTKKRCKQHVTE